MSEKHEQQEAEYEEPQNELPMNIQVATMALRLIHRSMRLEHFCDSSESGGNNDWEDKREEDINSRSVCRPLSVAEAELRDACCRVLSGFVSGHPVRGGCKE